MILSKEYIAGFFDGEGCIGIYTNGSGRFHLRTQLTQNKTPESAELVSYLKTKYGGNAASQPSKNGKIKYNWQLNCQLAATFLKDILPFLVLKKHQAELAIEWADKKPPIQRDKRGRIMSQSEKFKKYTIEVAKLLKQCKKD